MSDTGSPEQLKPLQQRTHHSGAGGGGGAGAGGGGGDDALHSSRRNLFPMSAAELGPPVNYHSGGTAEEDDAAATLRTLRSTGSGMSSLTCADLFQSSGDSIASYTASLQQQQGYLQGNQQGHQHHANPPPSLHGHPRLQPLVEIPTITVPTVPVLPSVVAGPSASQTPLQLSARQQYRAEKGEAAGSGADGKAALRNAPARLSTFELDVSNLNYPNSTKSNGPLTLGNAISARNSSTRNSTLNASKVKTQGANASGTSSTRAAKLRQNAQLLLTSPLSDWLTAGAQMQQHHQQQLSTGTGSSSGPATRSSPLVEISGKLYCHF